MRRTQLAVLLLALVLTVVSCKAKKALDEAMIAADLDKRGTTDLLKEASKDKYNAPTDGKLTDGQVQMYLKVREHETKIAEVARKELQQHAEKAKASADQSVGGMVEGFKALGAAADVMTADIRAAKDLGYNTAEYQWVKGQILAASSARVARKITEAGSTVMDSTLQQMKKQYDATTDPAARKMLGDMMAQYEKAKPNMAAQTDQEPAVAYNIQLLSKYENASNAIFQEYTKFGGVDSQQPTVALENWEKQMDKAVANAQTSTAQQGSGQ